MTDIANRVAFITGAGGGLGAGIARALAAEGASLALVDINSSLLAERKAEFDELGVPCETRTIDISDAEAVNAATIDLTARLVYQQRRCGLRRSAAGRGSTTRSRVGLCSQCNGSVQLPQGTGACNATRATRRPYRQYRVD